MIVYRTALKAPSDEGLSREQRDWGRENKIYPYFLSLRLRLRRIHLPRQREVLAVAICKINSNLQDRSDDTVLVKGGDFYITDFIMQFFAGGIDFDIVRCVTGEIRPLRLLK